MEKFKHKNGSGSLFANNFKTKDNQPNMVGVIVTPDGKEYRISAWNKEGAKGPFLSLSMSEPQPVKPIIENENKSIGKDNLPF